MKSSLPALVAVLFALFHPLEAEAQNTVQQSYNRGVALFNQGKFDEALVLFEQVLKVRPDLVYARNYAAKCKTSMAQNLGPKNDLEGRLGRLIIPEINFNEAPLGDVLDYFSARAQEISGGTVTVNFIYKGSSEQRSNTLITLSLRNVPMNEALKYVGQLSQSAIKYEEHAVVVDPSPQATAPQTETSVAPVATDPQTNLFE